MGRWERDYDDYIVFNAVANQTYKITVTYGHGIGSSAAATIIVDGGTITATKFKQGPADANWNAGELSEGLPNPVWW